MAISEQPPCLFYVGSSKDKDNDLLAENLFVDVRLFLGILGTCRRPSRQELADAMGKSPEWVEAARKLLIDNKDHPTIATILEQGLPLDASAPFPEESRLVLRCRRCKQPLLSVPCARCCIVDTIKAYRSHNTRAKRQPDAPQCESPTQFLPGTVSKMQVMRLRVACGYSAFCKGDAPLPAGQPLADDGSS